MKEDKVTPEDVWQSIITALHAAEEAGKWAFWRQRFNCNHPNHTQQQEIENPTRYAEINWRAAKYLYCKNKDAMDKLYNDFSAETFKNINSLELFKAMARVVEEEMSEQLEKQILEENVNIKLNDPELKETVEIDEDEQYVQETTGRWDKDDFLAEDEDDGFFDDEDDLEDFEDDEE